MTNEDSDYWDSVAREWTSAPHRSLWRRHSDEVNQEWLGQWLSRGRVDRLLKTDLFDEAVNAGVYPLLAQRARFVFGIDLSGIVVSASRHRYEKLQGIVTDIRRLPFRESAFDVVVSVSSLDHFDSSRELVSSLQELHKILRPDGLLLLTLDSSANPLVALRNVLPAKWLRWTGLVPFKVGQTWGPRRLRRSLEECGFRVRAMGSIMHCPRVIAVGLASFLEQHASWKVQKRFLNILGAFERLSHWPTRFVTGYFLAVVADRFADRNLPD